MLHTLLSIIVDDLNGYLANKYQSMSQSIVTLANASKKDFDQEGSVADGQVIAHCLNLEHEQNLGNEPTWLQSDGQTLQEVYNAQFNAYLLFVFHSQQYAQSLMIMADVVNYYQGKRYLERSQDHTNVTINDTTIAPEPDFRVEMAYHNISLEDSHNMWSNLGNKQQPFAIYKLKVVEFVPPQDQAITSDKIASLGTQTAIKQ